MYVCYHTFYGCVSYLITTVVTVVLGNNGHTLTKNNAKLCISCFHEIGFIANVWKKWGIALQAIWIRNYLLVSELSCNNHCPSSLPDRHTYHKTDVYRQLVVSIASFAYFNIWFSFLICFLTALNPPQIRLLRGCQLLHSWNSSSVVPICDNFPVWRHLLRSLPTCFVIKVSQQTTETTSHRIRTSPP